MSRRKGKFHDSFSLHGGMACVRWLDQMKQAIHNDYQVEVYRRLAPWQRLKAASELYWFAREIIKNRIRRLNSNMDDAEIEKRVRVIFHK